MAYYGNYHPYAHTNEMGFSMQSSFYTGNYIIYYVHDTNVSVSGYIVYFASAIAYV